MDSIDFHGIKNSILHILILIVDGITNALVPAFVLSPHHSLSSGYLLSEAVSKANEVDVYVLVSGLAAATAGAFYLFDKYYPNGSYRRDIILRDMRVVNMTFIIWVLGTIGYLVCTERYPYSSAVKERMWFLSSVSVFVIAKPYVYNFYDYCMDLFQTR